MTNHTPHLGDVVPVPGDLDMPTTVGASVPAVIERTELAQQEFDGHFDPWGDLIAEDEQYVSPPRQLRTNEVNEILGIFSNMLEGVLGDGAAKRARGEKPSWKVDPSHPEKALGHLDPVKYPERYDKTSGCNHKVHSACRLLMWAYQEAVEDGLIPGDPT